VKRATLEPRDLTIPDAGSKTAYEVLSRAIARVLAEARPILKARTGGAVGGDVSHAAPIASALRRPNAGALVRAMREAEPRARDAYATELAAIVCFELASRGALAKDVRIDRPPARIVSLAERVAIDTPNDATSVTFGARGTVFQTPRGDELADAPRAPRPYHAIDGDIVLALADNNPLAMFEAHPDKEGNAIDLGGRSPEEWTRALADALAIIARHLPDLRREMDLYVSQIVPVGYDAEKHLSASYREAIGTIYMTLHPSTMTLAEALIHEFSHNKINALFEIDDVLENAFFPLYKSPVRPDPRPLHGVLLAVHAFLPVARLYEMMIEARDPLASSASFRGRYRQIIGLNREGASVVLENAMPTRAGRAVLDEIARWDAHFEKVT
jgi:HEXXH motif-containing protein